MVSQTAAVRIRASVVLVAMFALGTVGFGAPKPPRSARKQAGDILKATGIKGGLIVHLGCGDGRLTAALGSGDSFLVHGLDADAKNVAAAREYIRSLGDYGKVAVDRIPGSRLPYINNLVNLVVAEAPLPVTKEEIIRVLAPKGVAYIREGGAWRKYVKGRPDSLDEWTHYFHDADGNPVADDTAVGPPRRMQWVGSPRWSRHHDHMASLSALVSANGRIFYIMDLGSKASVQVPPKWFLVARDAFNGTELWIKPISLWNTHLWPLKSGPAQLPRRLVAVGDEVYVTLGLDAPVTALDAATGKVIRTYKASRGTEELIALDGVLFLQVSDTPTTNNLYRLQDTYVWDNTRRANRGWAWEQQKRRVVAVRADTGKVLWKDERPVTPMTLAADKEHVYVHDGEKIVCLNRTDGEEVWHSEPVERRTPVQTSFGPRLIAHGDVVLFAGGTRSMSAFSKKNGKTLWTAKHARSGHQSPEDLMVVDDLVWSGATANGRDSGIYTGRDLHTGEVKVEFPPDIDIYWFHQRCYTSKATVNYLLPSRTGIEFVDFRKKHWDVNHWVRGGCIYGIMPCNGLVYSPPHPCACYLESKLSGFCALAPEQTKARADRPAGSEENRLVHGPAYDAIQNSKSKIQNESDWPTYRRDPARSGSTKASVPARLKEAWKTKLGGKLSSIVVAGGTAYIAAIDAHTLFALDAGSGDTRWTYTAGGRIDSPPTVYKSRVLFGSADGWVYCLRAADGELAWRFRAAPEDKRIVSFDQIESVWPVSGSVLVQDDVLYCVAGRSMFLDGGMRLLRLNPRTGQKISETVLDDTDPNTGKNLHEYVKGLNMPVSLPDVLSSDGRYVYMRSQVFNLDGKRREVAQRDVTDQIGDAVHLFAPAGFLDDSRFHRSYWMYGQSTASGWGGWFRAGRLVPYGRPLVCDDSHVYGFGRKPAYLAQSSVLEFQLFAADKEVTKDSIERIRSVTNKINKRLKKRNAAAADWHLRTEYSRTDLSAAGYKWVKDDPPFQPRAMVLAGDTLFMAGPPDVVDEEESFFNPDDRRIQRALKEQGAAFDNRRGAVLWAVSALDGEKIAEYKLDTPPAWDGMAAANRRLYMSTSDGKVLCLEGK